jgi:hypothetical protein
VLLENIKHEVVTSGLPPSVAFLWFLTNALGPYIRPFSGFSENWRTGPGRWDEYKVWKSWSRTKEKRRSVTTQKLKPHTVTPAEASNPEHLAYLQLCGCNGMRCLVSPQSY